MLKAHPTQLLIVYQDEQLIVFDKPPGLVVDNSISSQTDTLEEYLKQELKSSLKRGGIVHRLDKDTSGLIVVARTQLALDNLQAQFKSRQTKKEYLALVHGTVQNPGEITAPILRNPRNKQRFIVDQAGREAITRYEPIEQLVMSSGFIEKIFGSHQAKKLLATNYQLLTLLRVHPLTGRTHQIRVHLKYAGFPIVADARYGGRKVAALDSVWCQRQFLHAHKLSLLHPQSGQRMEFVAPLAADLEQVLTILTTR